MRFGLRWQIVVSLMVLMVATILLVSVAMLGLIQRNMERQAEHTAERVARIAATTMGSAVAPGEPLESDRNRANLARLSELFSEQFEAARMTVVAPDGAVVAAYPPGGAADSVGVEFLVSGAVDDLLTRLHTREDGVRQVDVYAPVRLDSDVVAVLRLQQPLGDVQRLVNASQQLVLLYVILDAFLIVVFGYFLLTRLIVRPVLAISAATDRVADGDFSSRVEVESRNELGELADNFARMVDRLRTGRDALESRVDELARSKAALERAQEEVLRSEKMATVGGLAAGIAHEIGNPLAAVMGLLDLLADPDGLSAEQRVDLHARVDRELHRIHTIIGELLDYARVSESSPESVRLEEPVESAVGLCAHHPRGRNVTVTVETEAPDAMVHASANRLVQVFLNLLLNAADAIGQSGGEVAIRWRSAERDGEAGVEVIVEDDGPGVPETARAELFEPFFTTKGPGEGTGLGLAIAARIVGQYRGHIWVEDAESGGAAFRLWLPSPPA